MDCGASAWSLPVDTQDKEQNLKNTPCKGVTLKLKTNVRIQKRKIYAEGVGPWNLSAVRVPSRAAAPVRGDNTSGGVGES